VYYVYEMEKNFLIINWRNQS